MAARVKALEAAHGLWKRLMTVTSPAEAAIALAEAALLATSASHAVVLGKQMEPLAVRGREGALSFSPQLIDDTLCREALKRKAPAATGQRVAVPLVAGEATIGVLTAAGTTDAEAVMRLAEAYVFALKRA